MTDKDRKAFEEFYGSPRMDSDGNFKDRRDEAAYELWQAAATHYAPKLTEAEAVEKAALCMINAHLTALGAWTLEEARKREDWQLLKSYAVTVFSAIGVQFREEP